MSETQPLVPKKAISLDTAPSSSSSSSIPDTNNDRQAKESIADDMIDILKLGIPIFVSSLSFVGKKTTDTALLGHVSQEALSASALSDLWTMTSQVLLNGGVLTVFIGSAVGAGNPKLAGIYLQVSYVVLFAMSVIVIIAWNVTEQVWLAFGSDPEISNMAGYYSRVLSVAIPGMVAFSQLSQFFSAQRIMQPEVNASSLGLIFNLVFGLIFVLGWPISEFSDFSGYGFAACPIVTSAVTYLQLAFVLFVYVHVKKVHEKCWPGWQLSEITPKRIWTFSELYFPAALSLGSDFWRVAVIGGVAAKLGTTEVAVFNTSYRVCWIALIFVGALSGASSINMSLRLGKHDPWGARQVGTVGIAMSFIMLTILSIFIVSCPRWIAMIFTQDEEFLVLFEQASVPFTITLFMMNMSVAIERIPYSMGRTKEIFWMGFVASWGGQVPGVILLTRYWRNDLVGLYWGMALGYFVLVILYGLIAVRSDWEHYAHMAQERAESKHTGAKIASEAPSDAV
jgi:multidrug resistance protein, MATE family